MYHLINFNLLIIQLKHFLNSIYYLHFYFLLSLISILHLHFLSLCFTLFSSNKKINFSTLNLKYYLFRYPLSKYLYTRHPLLIFNYLSLFLNKFIFTHLFQNKISSTLYLTLNQTPFLNNLLILIYSLYSLYINISIPKSNHFKPPFTLIKYYSTLKILSKSNLADKLENQQKKKKI
jgi:hypothetical protein